MDPLSEVLKLLRVEGAMFLESEFTAPWCVRARFGLPDTGAGFDARKDVAFFHWVVAGECKVRLCGDSEARNARAGDLILFPHDDLHLVGSDLQIAPMDSWGSATFTEGQLQRLKAGGGGAATHVICGYVCCNREVLRPLLSALPSVLIVPVGLSPDAVLFHQVLQAAVNKSASSRAGSATTLAKLAELLFVEAMRLYVESQPAHARGWLAGLRDPQIGKALRLLHSQPASNWTVEELSRQVALSRSTLAERFTALVGEPPVQYLKRLRLAKAAHELSTSWESVGKVAERVGYESEAAFNRAFKNEYGIPPAAWRRAKLG